MAAVTQTLAATIVAQRGDPRPPVGRLQRSADGRGVVS